MDDAIVHVARSTALVLATVHGSGGRDQEVLFLERIRPWPPLGLRFRGFARPDRHGI